MKCFSGGNARYASYDNWNCQDGLITAEAAGQSNEQKTFDSHQSDYLLQSNEKITPEPLDGTNGFLYVKGSPDHPAS